MNAKKAKALRRQARELTEGKPERRYLRHNKTGEIINDPNTTRGTYRQLKREARRG